MFALTYVDNLYQVRYVLSSVIIEMAAFLNTEIRLDRDRDTRDSVCDVTVCTWLVLSLGIGVSRWLVRSHLQCQFTTEQLTTTCLVLGLQYAMISQHWVNRSRNCVAGVSVKHTHPAHPPTSAICGDCENWKLPFWVPQTHNSPPPNYRA